MCGITGVLAHDASAIIGRMTESLSHRGPDGEGFYHADGIALGHRRLSIIDLAGGRQPISNESGTVFLVCNGEIYNSPELRNDLLARGHRFSTATDVEVIVHLYEEYGRDCVRHLQGMFAFGLWDSSARRLLLARDPMGQKPLFYTNKNGRFSFASEVKALLSSEILDREIDLDGLWHYISLRFIPDHHSLFKNITKLPAGSSLEWHDGQVSVERYWNLDFRHKLPHDEGAIVEGLDRVLRDTVRSHLLSDVPVGVFLSGGIDSSTVAAMVALETGAPIPSFSIGVHDDSFNELPYARTVAARYGLEAHERIVQSDIVNVLPKMIQAMDEPSDPFALGVHLVSKLASEHVKVVLGGDGGDENFAGYDRFAGQRFAEIYAATPAWFRKKMMARVIACIPESFAYKSVAQKAAWMNHMSFFSAGERYAESMSFLRFTQEAKQKLFTEAARQSLGDPDSISKILIHFQSDKADDLVDKMLMTDLMTRMPDHLLTILDRMAMAHGLEGRSPMVDSRFVEYAASIPSDLKLHGHRLKYILRKVAARYLPRELIERKKQGFGFPIGRWMRGPLAPLLNSYLGDNSEFVALGIFEPKYVRALMEEHMSGRVDHSFRLWILLNLEIWYRLYFKRESAGDVGSDIDRLVAI
jgi:asparagine synthase (glutamine-hydrolysing)